VECTSADVVLTLTASVRLVSATAEHSGGAAFLPAHAAGPPAAALAGGVTAEFLAWSPARRAAAAAALVGRHVRAVVLPPRAPGGSGAIAEAAGVLVLD
jgi:hypothetical protein